LVPGLSGEKDYLPQFNLSHHGTDDCLGSHFMKVGVSGPVENRRD
jgi:hypothetical protein